MQAHRDKFSASVSNDANAEEKEFSSNLESIKSTIFRLQSYEAFTKQCLEEKRASDEQPLNSKAVKRRVTNRILTNGGVTIIRKLTRPSMKSAADLTHPRGRNASEEQTESEKVLSSVDEPVINENSSNDRISTDDHAIANGLWGKFKHTVSPIEAPVQPENLCETIAGNLASESIEAAVRSCDDATRSSSNSLHNFAGRAVNASIKSAMSRHLQHLSDGAIRNVSGSLASNSIQNAVDSCETLRPADSNLKVMDAEPQEMTHHQTHPSTNKKIRRHHNSLLVSKTVAVRPLTAKELAVDHLVNPFKLSEVSTSLVAKAMVYRESALRSDEKEAFDNDWSFVTTDECTGDIEDGTGDDVTIHVKLVPPAKLVQGENILINEIDFLLKDTGAAVASTYNLLHDKASSPHTGFHLLRCFVIDFLRSSTGLIYSQIYAQKYINDSNNDLIGSYSRAVKLFYLLLVALMDAGCIIICYFLGQNQPLIFVEVSHPLTYLLTYSLTHSLTHSLRGG